MRICFWRHTVVYWSLLAVSLSGPSLGQEIAATVEWNPMPRQAPSSVTPLVRDDAGNTLPAQQQGDTWTYVVRVLGTIFEAFEVSLSGEIPVEYDFSQLRLEVPYYTERTAAAVLAPTRRANGAKAVRTLFARQTDAMSARTLQISYQEARSTAFARMEVLQKRWNLLHDYDVQAVYKFLEISVALTRRTPFVPMTADLDEAFEWLSDAMANKADRVTHAMGGDSALATRVLRDISAVRGNRLGDLWKRIKHEADDNRRCTLLESYYQYLSTMPSDDYRIAVKVTGVPIESVSSAQAICVVNLSRAGRRIAAITPRVLTTRMEGLLDHAVGDVQRMLQSDIAVVRDFL